MTAGREDPTSSAPEQKDRARRLSEERQRLLKALLEEPGPEPEGPEQPPRPPEREAAWGPDMRPPMGGPPPGAGAGPWAGFAWGGGPGSPFGGFPGGIPPEWQAFFNAPAAGPAASSASPLVALKPSGSRAPFFCVHAMLGSVFRYHHLAVHLPAEQPLYGLQARGLDGLAEPHTQVEDMAGEYVQAIRGVQPTGPYYLGGYSLGGLVAFEMAQQLLRAGERVALLALLGTSAPAATPRPFDFWLGYLESAQRLVTNTFKAYQPPFMQGAGMPQPGLPPPLRVAMACIRAAMRYVPRTYPGPLDVFATAEQLAMTRADLTLGWRAFCTGRIELHPVEGNHLSMIEEPAVRDVARKLTACLAREATHARHA